MHYEIQHHRAVVQRVSEMFSDGYIDEGVVNPITARARDAALYIFSRRPDIALGVALQKTCSGGLRFDIVRQANDFVFEITEDGHVSLITSYAQHDPVNGTIFSKSVHEDFFDRLEMVLPDPIANLRLMQMPQGLPFSGIIGGQVVTSEGEVLKCVRTNDDIYISWSFSSSIFNFNRIAVSIPRDIILEPDDMMINAITMATNGAQNMVVVRDAGIGGFVSLHRVDMFSESFCKRLKFKDGQDLFAFQKAWFKKHDTKRLDRLDCLPVG